MELFIGDFRVAYTHETRAVKLRSVVWAAKVSIFLTEFALAMKPRHLLVTH
jgi:hypothetical protein